MSSEEKNIDYNTEQINKSFNEFAEEHNAIKNKYRVPYKLKKEDLKNWKRAKVGDVITRNPEIPNNPKEAFELFKNFYAAVQCALAKHHFLNKYRIVNEASLKAEIHELDKWIEESKKLSYADAVKDENRNNKRYIYLKLINGYYDGYLMTWQEHQETSAEANVYGTYVLFYEYLKEQLNEMLKTNQLENGFDQWVSLKVDWKKAAFEYNTGKNYQQKQDLIALFWNAYIYFPDKLVNYRSIYGMLPNEYLNKMLFEFRQAFPKHGRIEGVNYFDDLIEQFMAKETLATYNSPDRSSFYEQIANSLYTGNMKINYTEFTNRVDYIEAMHSRAEFKGDVFYTNLSKAMIPHYGAKLYRDIFKEVLTYCGKMGGVKKHSAVNTISSDPIFKPEIIEQLYEILKDYFGLSEQSLLKELLYTPSRETQLTFITNGNRLADLFKQLIDASLILNINKKMLELWIKEHFMYTSRGSVREFTLRYLNDIISTNKDKCAKPLINVRFDKVSNNYQIVRV